MIDDETEHPDAPEPCDDDELLQELGEGPLNDFPQASCRLALQRLADAVESFMDPARQPELVAALSAARAELEWSA